MKALVLGGNGFIGSHLVQALSSAGCRVRVFDRRVAEHSLQAVEYHIGSLNDTAQVAEALWGVDIVFHLISTSVPSTSNLDPVGDIQGNLVGTVTLLEQMVKTGVNRIVYLSSGGTVYGNPACNPVSESHPLRPICSYGIVKVAIENYLFMFQQLYGIEPTVLRASNPYGPLQGHLGVQGVIPTFLDRVMRGEDIEIWGDGSVVRDYLYVSDLIDLCMKAAFQDVTGVFNAGSGKGYSLTELIQVIKEVVGQDIEVSYLKRRAFDVSEIILDIEKAARSFDWRPTVDLKTGIARHWEWLLDDSTMQLEE